MFTRGLANCIQGLQAWGLELLAFFVRIVWGQCPWKTPSEMEPAKLFLPVEWDRKRRHFLSAAAVSRKLLKRASDDSGKLAIKFIEWNNKKQEKHALSYSPPPYSIEPQLAAANQAASPHRLAVQLFGGERTSP
jgi:hypothetical protein